MSIRKRYLAAAGAVPLLTLAGFGIANAATTSNPPFCVTHGTGTG